MLCWNVLVLLGKIRVQIKGLKYNFSNNGISEVVLVTSDRLVEIAKAPIKHALAQVLVQQKLVRIAL